MAGLLWNVPIILWSEKIRCGFAQSVPPEEIRREGTFLGATQNGFCCAPGWFTLN
jgi:hypothetical protein